MMFFLLLLLPKATKHGTFQGPSSLEPFIGHQIRCFPIDHQAWNVPLAIKCLPLPLSFSLKVQIWIICLYFWM